MLAYHFTNDRLRDGRPVPPVGKTLVHEGKVIPCRQGLHASLEPFDALKYAPGNNLHLVRLGGTIVRHGGDKVVASERTILKSFNSESLLRKFACQQALSVAHLWDMPKVVRDYLRTGDERKKDAARNAARDAARAAARAAAWDAARNAAWDAARVAARNAAWDAARVAARAAAWDAAWDVARNAAWDAARNAAGNAAWAAARKNFNQMVEARFNEM